MKAKWLDKPVEIGHYWVSPGVEILPGRYGHTHPFILEVVEINGRLEVKYMGGFPPVYVVIVDYLPDSKWLLIEIPNWKSLNK